MLVPSNWCSLIEIMSRHRLWLNSRCNIHGIHRGAIYFLHSFGILIFISRFRVVVITHWSAKSRGGGEIKGSGKSALRKIPGVHSLLIHPRTGLMITASLQRIIISDRSFQVSLLPLLTSSYSFIAAGRINYLFCARGCFKWSGPWKEFPRTSWHSHNLFRFVRYKG